MREPSEISVPPPVSVAMRRDQIAWAANKFIESLPAAVGGGEVLAALVLAIIALLVAGGVRDRVEELTEKMEELEAKIEELKRSPVGTSLQQCQI